MKVTAPIDCYIAALGVDVKKGDEIEVDADIGAGLVEQGWTSARQRAAKKAARSRLTSSSSRSTRKNSDAAPAPEPEPEPQPEPPAPTPED